MFPINNLVWIDRTNSQNQIDTDPLSDILLLGFLQFELFDHVLYLVEFAGDICFFPYRIIIILLLFRFRLNSLRTLWICYLFCTYIVLLLRRLLFYDLGMHRIPSLIHRWRWVQGLLKLRLEGKLGLPVLFPFIFVIFLQIIGNLSFSRMLFTLPSQRVE